MEPIDAGVVRRLLAELDQLGLQLTLTVSGVSSMMTSTPVAVSKARMFRPSRPMIRPFISSLGICTTETVDSAVTSEV